MFPKFRQLQLRHISHRNIREWRRNLILIESNKVRYNAAYPTARYNEFVTKAGCASAASKFDCLVSKDSMTLQLASSNVSTSQVYGTWYGTPLSQHAALLASSLTRLGLSFLSPTGSIF